MPSTVQLPGGDPDLAVCHDAAVTADTIIPGGLADRFDLELAVWACLANSQLAERRARQQAERDQQLAA